MDMTQDQKNSARPDTAPDQAIRPISPADGDFAEAIRGALELFGVPEKDHAAIISLVAKAHHDRMKVDRESTTRLSVADRAHHSAMQFAKKVIGQALEVNARQHAYCEMITAIRDDLQQVVDRARDHHSEILPVAEVLRALAEHRLPSVPQTPVIVGFSPSTQFSHGRFRDRDGVVKLITFVGWSLVAFQPRIGTALEPTFTREAGHPLTQAALFLEGLTLEQLV